jgi:(p)ppGpp synthase/HD superfamily hydrolase
MNRFEFFVELPPMSQEERKRVHWAYAISKKWHHGQSRDAGERYSNHPRRVAALLVEHGYAQSDYLIIAFCHDLLEDTFFPLSLFEQIFGPEIARGVMSVSKTYGIEDPLDGTVHKIPKRPKDEYFEGVKKFGRRAAIVKCADRIDNLQDLMSNDQPEGSRWTPEKRLQQVEETREWILPLADMYEPRFAEKLRHMCDLTEANVKLVVQRGSPC